MRKKWFAVLLIVLMIAGSINGCSKKEGIKETVTTTDTGTTEAVSGDGSETEGTETLETGETLTESAEETTAEASDSTNEPSAEPSTKETVSGPVSEVTTESTTQKKTEQSTLPAESAESTERPESSEATTEPEADLPEKGGPVAENFYGTWYGAENSLDGKYYTGYIELSLTKDEWSYYDAEAGNPGTTAKIIEVTADTIILEPTEVEDSPANWKLKEGEKSVITYDNPNQYELRMTLDGMTCIFYRRMKSVEGAAGDFIDPYVGPVWASVSGEGIGVRFSYYDMEFVDLNNNGKVLLAGNMIIDAEKSEITVIPDVTKGFYDISLWPGLSNQRYFKITTEHYGEEEIRITWMGKTHSFSPEEV